MAETTPLFDSEAQSLKSLHLGQPKAKGLGLMFSAVALVCGATGAVLSRKHASRFVAAVPGEPECGEKELAYYTLIGANNATFKNAGSQGQFTYFNMTLGPANLAPLVSVRAQAGDADVYSTIRTTAFFDEWRYGFVKDGQDFNPDTFVVPEDMIVDEQGMSAAVTVRFSEADGSTKVFPAQFVALDRATPDVPGLYTMVVRVYADDATTAAQLQPSRGEGHTCYDAAAPHFHTLPHEKLDSVLGSSATALIESEFFVVDVYLDPLDILVLVTVVAGSSDIAMNAGDDMPVNVP